MERKPDYRRLLKTIRHEEPDFVPVVELAISRPMEAAFLGKPVNTLADEVEFWHRAGYDYMYQRANYEYAGMPPEVAVGTKLVFDADVLGKAVSRDMMQAGGAINSMADFETHPWPDPQTVDVTRLDEMERLLPDGMGIITGIGGIFTRSWMLTGFERLSLAMYDEPELVKAVFEKVGCIQCEVLRRLVKKDRVFAVWYGDDLAYTEGLMMSPAFFREYLFPWLEEIAAIAHGAGMPLIMHTDGKLNDIMDDLIALGLDALHAIEPKAMDIRELKRTYGKQLALFGNVDINVLGLGSVEETRNTVRALIRDVAPGGGYALGSANTIPGYVKLENYKAMLTAAFDYGQYPIRC